MKANNLRKSILKHSYRAKACHIGSALSCVEILLAIDQVKKKNDIFLFSKASGVSAHYCLLSERGVIPKNKLTFYLENYPLAHKDVPGVIHSVGSLGHGLSVATGIAFADRSKKVYCLISDGELNEGQTWEALLFVAHHRLRNLTIVLDYNHLQACGDTQDILELENLNNKFRAFNLDCQRIDGHNQKEIEKSLTKQTFSAKVIICETTKGKGIDFMEDDYTWHYRNLDNLLLQRALKQL